MRVDLELGCGYCQRTPIAAYVGPRPARPRVRSGTVRLVQPVHVVPGTKLSASHALGGSAHGGPPSHVLHLDRDAPVADLVHTRTLAFGANGCGDDG